MGRSGWLIRAGLRMMSAVVAPAMIGVAGMGGVGSAAHAASTRAAVDLTGSVSKRIVVNGQSVQVTVSASSVSVLAAIGKGPFATTFEVRLSSGDGTTPLPEVVPTRLTLERVRPPARVVRLGLTAVPTFAADPVNAFFTGDATPAYVRGARLRPTVRLQIGQGVRIVRLGELRVRATLPPFVALPGLEDQELMGLTDR